MTRSEWDEAEAAGHVTPDQLGTDEPIGYGACVASILELSVDLFDANGERHTFPIPNLMAEGYIKRDDADVAMTRCGDEGVTLRWL